MWGDKGISPQRPSAAEPQLKEKSMIHRRGTEFAEFGVFLIKNSLLRASAVSSFQDRDSQNSHWEIWLSCENFHGW
jgi:hypothetical protein